VDWGGHVHPTILPDVQFLRCTVPEIDKNLASIYGAAGGDGGQVWSLTRQFAKYGE